MKFPDPCVEIIGTGGEVHYRRPVGDPLIEEATRTPGYSVRYRHADTCGFHLDQYEWECTCRK